jgi:hypothetical protein
MLPCVALALAAGTACHKKSPDEKKAEIRTDAAHDMAKVDKEAAEDNRDAFVKRTQARVDELNDQIKKLDDDADKKDDAAKASIAPALADAKAKKEAADSRLKSLKDANGQDWLAMRTDVNAAIGDLETAVTNAAQAVQAH